MISLTGPPLVSLAVNSELSLVAALRSLFTCTELIAHTPPIIPYLLHGQHEQF
jgi:hypothetical protein